MHVGRLVGWVVVMGISGGMSIDGFVFGSQFLYASLVVKYYLQFNVKR